MDNLDTIESASFKFPSREQPLRQLTLDLTPDEAQHLEDYCRQTGKGITNVIEELIHQLPEP